MIGLVLLAVIGLVGFQFVTGPGSGPQDRPAGEPRRRPAQLQGVPETGFRLSPTPSARTAGERLGCLFLAADPEFRGRGLMNVTDLGDYDGMVFVFESDTNGSFFMKDTPMPLSIAWFDAEGNFVSSADMEPCLDQASCPLYGPTSTYRLALEVPKGGLEPLGVGPGSRLELVPDCR
ncbi:MAG: DUF192 domain-containing protein [Acidimicrobiales bacterium]